MPVTLAQAALNTQDDVDFNVINEFRATSAMLDALPFHQAVDPSGMGSTLTYGYTRQLALRSAAFRAINSEYTPEEATKQRFSTDLKPLGGSFQIDRVLAATARGAEVSFQMRNLIQASVAKFTNEVINGDTATDEDGFDGLDKALRGSTTEVNATTASDWTDMDTYGYQNALDLVDELLSYLDGQPGAIIANSRATAKLRAIARRANQYVSAPVDGLMDAASGRAVTRQFWQEGTLLIDAGDKPGTASPIVPIISRDLTSSVLTLTITGSPTGGTYTLTVTNATEGTEDTTAALAHNANAAAIEAAIEALDNVEAADVAVTGSGPFTITFAGTDDYDVETDASLTGGISPDAVIAESGTGDTTGLTDIYAVRFGMDGFHAVATTGPLVRTWLPDFTTAGAVKTGEAELGPVSVVLKATKAAAVLRNIKVA